jgi:hypothetical protein
MLLETTVPSGSLEPAVEALTVVGAAAVGGVMLRAATGGWFGTVSWTPADILLVSEGLPTAFTKTM